MIISGEKIGWAVRYHNKSVAQEGYGYYAYVTNPTNWQLLSNIVEAHVFGCNSCIKNRLAHTEDPKGFEDGVLVKIKKTVTIEELAEGSAKEVETCGTV